MATLTPDASETYPDSPREATTAARRPRGSRRWVYAAGGLALAAVLAWWLVPLVTTALDTVSTDDAYVNGHFTNVAARVDGQVAQVLVDDNMRVSKGDLLVKLDPEPYRVAVDQKRALLEVARAKLVQAEADVRSLEASARSKRWKLQSTMEQVSNQVAALNAAVAVLESRRATVERARRDFVRVERLIARGAATQEELDTRREGIKVAEAQVEEAVAQVHELRVGLGLPPEPPQGKPLTDVPANLSETYSGVRMALADVVQSVAALGLPLARSEATPSQFLDEFRKLDRSGSIDVILGKLVHTAPGYRQAEAAVLQARRDLEQAELNLRYCDVLAEIDGVVTRRSVNPGNNVKAGQGLMALRSVTDVWVDANFKETQLAGLRIGQPVDLYADIYGRSRVYKGRVSGFTMGTGSTLALLPPQNATGNFVKVVQRLPVRIDLLGGNPEDAPLFIGLSVVPYVHFKARPTGPDAGRRLQSVRTPSAAATAASANAPAPAR